MNQGIGLKTILCPEVRGNVSVWRSSIRSVNNLERIFTGTGCVLRQQYNITELQAGDSQPSVSGCHVVTGKLSVSGNHFSILLGTDRLFYPAFILFSGDQFRISGFHEAVESTFCVQIEYCSL